MGAPFKANRAYAERFGDAGVILSAKYGFIRPDFRIATPYSTTFKKRSTNPVSISDDAYRELDATMWDKAGDVSDTAWGHKYFHLMFPDKLDDYHNFDYQRFYLVKLLQIPREGRRYASAGQFVRVATELGLHVSILTKTLGERNGRPHRYWRVGILERLHGGGTE